MRGAYDPPGLTGSARLDVSRGGGVSRGAVERRGGNPANTREK
nr:MAG TPA: hypothetical protein [Caudoviricetes sp.]